MELYEFHHELFNIKSSSKPLSHMFTKFKYGMNPTYVKVIKQDLDKILNVCFIVPMGEASWLSPIVVVREKTTSSKYAWIFDNSMLLPKKSISFTFYWKGVGRSGRAWGLFVFYQIFDYHQIMIAFKNMYKTTFIIDWGTFI